MVPLNRYSYTHAVSEIKGGLPARKQRDAQKQGQEIFRNKENWSFVISNVRFRDRLCR